MRDRREYAKKYYEEHKEEYKKRKKKWRNINVEHEKDYQKEWRERRNKKVRRWNGFIPHKTQCEVCGKTIHFCTGVPSDSIHFDHKSYNVVIKDRPSNWLRNNKRTKENEKIWNSCNFGMLCSRCNSILPTKNRKKFLENLTKYILKDLLLSL